MVYQKEDMMNNTTEIFTTLYSTGLSLLANYGTYLLSLATLLVGKLVFDWWLKNRTADRQFLKNDIYSPLYEDIRQIAENISNFENCYSTGLSSQIGTVRGSLINRGKYSSIPKNLQKDIDSYYERCEEYNKQLKSAYEEIYKLFIEEIRKIKTEEDHKKFLHDNEGRAWRYDEVRKKRICNQFGTILNLKFLIKGQLPNHIPHLNDSCNHVYINTPSSRWDNTITIDDLKRNSLSIEDLLEKLIGLAYQKMIAVTLRELQNQLKNPVKLLKKLEKRIQNPNPLVEKLGL